MREPNPTRAELMRAVNQAYAHLGEAIEQFGPEEQASVIGAVEQAREVLAALAPGHRDGPLLPSGRASIDGLVECGNEPPPIVPYTRAQLAAAVDEAHAALHEAEACGGVPGDTPTSDALDRAHEALHRVGAGVPRVGCGLPDARRDPEVRRLLLDLVESARRELPCGHKIVDLIASPGTVTRCGACLSERAPARRLCGSPHPPGAEYLCGLPFWHPGPEHAALVEMTEGGPRVAVWRASPTAPVPWAPPRPPPGWQAQGKIDIGRGVFARVYLRSDMLKVLASVEPHARSGRWLHVSLSRPARLPSWQDVKDVKDLFVGDRIAVQMLPREAEYINHHPNCLHIWSCLDQPQIVPDDVLSEAEGGA